MAGPQKPGCFCCNPGKERLKYKKEREARNNPLLNRKDESNVS